MTIEQTRVRRRARPMSPDERRDALVEATLGLLREHGRAVTTRQIAEAAGVAEGTIFRVVDSKEELVEAALARAFDPGTLIERIAEIAPDQPLRDRLLDLATLMQTRLRATFGLMAKVGMVRPPDRVHDSPAAEAFRARLVEQLTALVGDDADRLTVPVEHFLHVLRLLAFAGSHPHISDGLLLTPEQIVDTVLFGLLGPDPRSEERRG